MWEAIITSPHRLRLITVAGIWFQTRFGFRICIRLYLAVYFLVWIWIWKKWITLLVSWKDSRSQYEAYCHDHDMQLLQ